MMILKKLFTFILFQRCDMCSYMNPNSDKVVKHIALGHSKLDEMLQNDELVQRKRELASTRPKRESIGPECPICNVKDPPRYDEACLKNIGTVHIKK